MLRLPVDVYIVLAPMGCALAALGGLVVKNMTTDPDFRTELSHFMEGDQDAVAKAAQKNEEGIKHLFAERIKQHRWSYFPNEVALAE